MTLSTLITLNAALGAATAYGLHHLLAHGIRSDEHQNHKHHEIARLPEHESERMAA